MSSYTTIIVAGGRGLRMGQDIPKQFLSLGNRPVLMHTIERFMNYDSHMKIVLVLPADQFAYWEALCRQHGFRQPHKLTKGGDTRFQSVKNGLMEVEPDGVVAIHDGVRPFVNIETIDRCFKTAEKQGTAIPVMEVTESIRKVEEQGSAMRPRTLYRTVQTPQVFKTSIVKKAYEQPFRAAFTDDASVVEEAGYEITLVEGNRENIKITSPFDLVVAEALLKNQPF